MATDEADAHAAPMPSTVAEKDLSDAVYQQVQSDVRAGILTEEEAELFMGVQRDLSWQSSKLNARRLGCGKRTPAEKFAFLTFNSPTEEFLDLKRHGGHVFAKHKGAAFRVSFPKTLVFRPRPAVPKIYELPEHRVPFAFRFLEFSCPDCLSDDNVRHKFAFIAAQGVGLRGGSSFTSIAPSWRPLAGPALRPTSRAYHRGTLPTDTFAAPTPAKAQGPQVHVVLPTLTLVTSVPPPPEWRRTADMLHLPTLQKGIEAAVGSDWSIETVAWSFEGLPPAYALATAGAAHSRCAGPNLLLGASGAVCLLDPVHDVQSTRRQGGLRPRSASGRPGSPARGGEAGDAQKPRKPKRAGPPEDADAEPTERDIALHPRACLKREARRRSPGYCVVTIRLHGESQEAWEALRDAFFAGSADPATVAALAQSLGPQWVNHSDHMTVTLCHAACAAPGNAPALEELLRACPAANLLPRDAFGRTPAHYAARGGRADCLRVLWGCAAAGLRVEAVCAVDRSRRTPLHLALLWRRRAVIDFYLWEVALGLGDVLPVADVTGMRLIRLCLNADVMNWWWPINDLYAEGAPLDRLEQCLGAYPQCLGRRDRLGLTLLHHAVFAGRLDAVRLLRARGAEVRADNRGFTPLHYACSQRDMLPIVAELVAACAPGVAAQANCHGMSAIHYAARSGGAQYLDALAARVAADGGDAAAELARPSKAARNFPECPIAGTPLHEAFLRRRRAVVEWYLFNGHLRGLRERDLYPLQRLFNALGLDPFWPLLPIYAGDLGVLDRCLALPTALTRRQDFFGWGLLHHAVASKRPEPVAHLLPAFGALDADFAGTTPLHYAAAKGLTQAASAILDKFPDAILRRTVHGDLPLHRALYWSRLDTAEFLLRHSHGRAQLQVCPLHPRPAPAPPRGAQEGGLERRETRWRWVCVCAGSSK